MKFDLLIKFVITRLVLIRTLIKFNRGFINSEKVEESERENLMY